MARRFLQTVIAASAAFVLVSGCGKKTTKVETVPQETAPKEEFAKPQPFADVDTSDDASFRQADLDAELERQVRENLLTVYFEFNSYDLTSQSTERLSRAASFLMGHSNMRVLVEGHCDERGSSEYNMGLGENRARAVKHFLTNYGIPSVQVETTSWGKEQPAQSGCMDDECHAMNRRCEFKVLAK